jgi:hypothetical protein
MTNLKQFNFKIPDSLHAQLEAAAKLRGTKMTNLIIQGIRQVLGITASSSELNIDLDIYESINKINLRLDNSIKDIDSRVGKLEQSQVDIAARLYQYIPELEHDLTQLRESIPSAEVVNDIAKIVYTKIAEDIKQLISESISNNIALNISESNAGIDIGKNIDEELQQEVAPLVLDKSKPNSTESESIENVCITSNDSPEEIQIEIPGIESNENTTFNNAKKINTVELLKILKDNDPRGRWDNNKLTNYRRNKKHKDKWHRVNDFRFKYANEIDENKVPGVSKHLHLWWLVQDEIKKEVAEYNPNQAQEQVENSQEKIEIHSDL